LGTPSLKPFGAENTRVCKTHSLTFRCDFFGPNVEY
jgi:hypothetical protein